MKARDWATKFNEAAKDDAKFYDSEGFNKLAQAYAEETDKLIAERTKNSGIMTIRDKKVDTRPAAVDGALREQRNKWQAICRQVSSLTTQNHLFDDLIIGHFLPVIALEQTKWKEAKAKATAKQETEATAGRALANSIAIDKSPKA